MQGDGDLSQDTLVSIKKGLDEVAAHPLFYSTPQGIVDALAKLFETDEIKQGDQVEARGNVYYFKVAETAPKYDVLPRRTPWYIAMTDEFIKAIQTIDRKLQGRILESITHLSQAPMDSLGDTVKPLTGELKGLWRYRLGDFRLIYRPNPTERTIVLVALAARGGAYQ